MSTYDKAQRNAWLSVLIDALLQLRASTKVNGDSLHWGKSRGVLVAGSVLGLITHDEYRRIEDLIDNALDNAIREAGNA